MSVTDWLTSVTHFSYDADGNLTAETFLAPANTTVAFTYSAADGLTRIVESRLTGSGPFRWTLGYGRDAVPGQLY